MKINRRKFLLRGFLLAILGLLLDAFWWEKTFIRLRRIYWKKAEKAAKTIRLLQISDVHLQSVGYALRRMARNVLAEKPDLLCFTGDLLDKSNKWEALDEFLALFPNELPKVAILGNWEYWGRVDLARFKTTLAQHNCQLLVNSSAVFDLQGKSLRITGVDDFLAGTPDYAAAEAQYQPADYHIVLNHCPQYTDTIRQLHQHPIDFILSGHTHGGQITLFGHALKLPPGSGNYVAGWYETPAPPMFVSKGIGTSMISARLGARAEVTLVHLEGA